MNHPSCGILLHLTSLPSSYGIGTLGQAAYDFVDFLRDAGQSCGRYSPSAPPDTGTHPISPSPPLLGIPISLTWIF